MEASASATTITPIQTNLGLLPRPSFIVARHVFDHTKILQEHRPCWSSVSSRVSRFFVILVLVRSALRVVIYKIAYKRIVLFMMPVATGRRPSDASWGETNTTLHTTPCREFLIQVDMWHKNQGTGQGSARKVSSIVTTVCNH